MTVNASIFCLRLAECAAPDAERRMHVTVCAELFQFMMENECLFRCLNATQCWVLNTINLTQF